MRVLAGLAIVAMTVLTGASHATPPPPSPTSLRVTYWEDSAKPRESVTWTLRCNPARGSLPRPAIACRRLAGAAPKLFARHPTNTACTQIYGGPQQARVVGMVSGRRVWATFTRTNGCEIERWQRISPWLVPPGVVS